MGQTQEQKVHLIAFSCTASVKAPAAFADDEVYWWQDWQQQVL